MVITGSLWLDKNFSDSCTTRIIKTQTEALGLAKRRMFEEYLDEVNRRNVVEILVDFPKNLAPEGIAYPGEWIFDLRLIIESKLNHQNKIAVSICGETFLIR